MEYTVIIHQAEESGYWVEVPTLSGCYSQGETIEEAMNNIKEAIKLHLEDLKGEKEIPKDKDFVIGRVEVPAV